VTSLKKQWQYATEMAAHWLYLGNVAADRGRMDLAERHYTRAQPWHDKMIDLEGRMSMDPQYSKLKREFLNR